MFETAIRSPEGKVYVRYFNPTPQYIKVGNKDYVCDVRHGVSMLAVDESEVQQLLDATGGCCGGRRKIFSLPGQEAVNVYLTGDR